MRYTRLMRNVARKYSSTVEKLPDILTGLYNSSGLPSMSEELGVSKATLWYWLLKFGIDVRRVAVRRYNGEGVYIGPLSKQEEARLIGLHRVEGEKHYEPEKLGSVPQEEIADMEGAEEEAPAES